MAQRSDIRVKLTPEGVAEVVRALRQVQKEAGDANKNTSALLKEIKALLPTLGFASVVTGFAALVRGAMNYADAVDEASQRTGASTENLTALAHAAKFSGISFEEVEAGLLRLNRSLADAADGAIEPAQALRELGLTMSDFAGRDAVQSLALVSERLGNIKDAAKETDVAMSLLGRGGARMLTVMRELGERGFAAVAKDAEAAGAVISTDLSLAAAAANDSIDAIGVMVQGLALQFVAGFAPQVTTALTSFRDDMRGKGVAPMQEFGDKAGRTFGIILAGTRWLTTGVAAAFDIVGKTIGGVIAQIEGFATGGVEGFKRAREAARQGLDEAVAANVKSMDEARTAFLDSLDREPIKVKVQAQADVESAESAGADIQALVKTRLDALTKQLGEERFKAIDALNKSNVKQAEQQIANEERLAQARARTDEHTVQIARQATQAREALARREYEQAVALAQQKEQALSDLTSRQIPRGRLQAETLNAIAKQSLDAQLAAAQAYYARLSQLQTDHVERYKASQDKIKALDKELADSKLANETLLRNAQRAGWTEQERQQAAFRDLEKLRADFGSAVVRNAGAEARAIKSQIDELVRGLVGVEGFENAVGRINGEVQALFGSLVKTEQAQQKAIGDQAAKDIKATNAELQKTDKLTKELAQQELAAVKPSVDEQGLRALRKSIQDSLLSAPFRIDLVQPGGAPVPQFAGGGYVPGRSPNPRADDKLARVTSGEFIHNVRAVRYYGVDFMADVNAMRFPRVPRFADGGLVGSATSADALDEVTLNLSINGSPPRRVRGPRDTVRSLVRDLDAVSRGAVK